MSSSYRVLHTGYITLLFPCPITRRDSATPVDAGSVNHDSNSSASTQTPATARGTSLPDAAQADQPQLPEAAAAAPATLRTVDSDADADADAEPIVDAKSSGNIADNTAALAEKVSISSATCYPHVYTQMIRVQVQCTTLAIVTCRCMRSL